VHTVVWMVMVSVSLAVWSLELVLLALTALP